MNIMNRITWQMMRKNRVRTIVTIIGIILSAAMFTAVFTMCFSLYNYSRDLEIDSSGSYHVHAFHVNGDIARAARGNDKLEYIAYARDAGYAEVDTGNKDKPYLFVLAVDKTFIANMPLKLVEGRLPENENELLIPAHLAANGGVQYAAGDTATLEIGQRMPVDDEAMYLYQDNRYMHEAEKLTGVSTVTYTVVGIIERPDFEQFSGAGYTAVTLDSGEIDDSSVYECYIRVKNPNKNLTDYIKENPQLLELCEEHSGLLALEGVTGYDNIKTVLIGFAVILALIVFVGSVALIYSAFSISVSERTKQFGLLSSVGATKKQTMRSVLFEALSLSAVGIPIGILAGIGGIALTLYLLREKFSSIIAGSDIPIRVYVTWPGIALAAVIALVTVLVSAFIPALRAMRISPMEAIRQKGDLKAKNVGSRYPKLAAKLFGAEGLLAKKYYKRSRKKYRTTIVSLVVSIVLFITASAFCMYMTDSINETSTRPNFDISTVMQRSDFARLRPALAECVDDIAAYSGDNLYYSAYIPEEDSSREYKEYMDKNIRPDDLYHSQQAQEYYMDDDAFRALLAQNGLDEELFFDPEDPRALVVNHESSPVYERQDEGSYSRITYSYDYFKTGVATLLTAEEPEPPAGYDRAGVYWSGSKRGEGELTAYYMPIVISEDDNIEFDEFNRPVGLPTEKLEFTERPIGAFLQEAPMGISGGHVIEMVYPLSLYTGDEQGMSVIFRSGDTVESIKKMSEIFRQAGLTVTDSTFYDVNDEYRTMGNIVTIVKVFSYGFITLISLIAVANVFNTVSTNVALRRRDYAMLRSMGMTQKGISRMSNYECLIYGSRSLLIGLPIAIALTYLIHKVTMQATVMSFRLPWTAIAIAVVSVFLVVFLSMLYSTSKLKKDNPIDALKDENI